MIFQGEYNYLSTMYKCPIILTQEELLKYTDDKLHDYITNYLPNGFQFNCVEQAFQSFKTKKLDEYIAALNADNGYIAKQISKKFHNRDKWALYRNEIMEFLIEKKFTQHRDLCKKIASIDKTIHNDVNYTDYYWGRVINENYKGQDILGQILNEQRKLYREAYYPEPIIAQQKTLNKGFNSSLDLQDKVDNFYEIIKDNYFFVIDTETSGIYPKTSDIIELSAIKVDGNTLEIIDEFDSLINPLYKLPKDIIEFNRKNQTGINDEVLSTAPLANEVCNRFEEFLGEEKPIIMGQNIPFDLRFLDKLYMKQLNKSFEYKECLDTLKLAKEKIPGKHNLERLYSLIPNAPELSFHKSIDDVKATLEVFKWLSKEYGYINDVDYNHINEDIDTNIILD